MNEQPYSKREHDAFREENKKLFDRVMDMLEKQNHLYEKDSVLIAELCKISSHNSGQITALWKDMERNGKATKLIEDVIKVSNGFKWLFYITVGVSSLIVALKTILSTNFLKFIEIWTK